MISQLITQIIKERLIIHFQISIILKMVVTSQINKMSLGIFATNKRVSGKLGGLFWLNRTDSGLVGLYGLNHSDSAAHAKHYMNIDLTKYFKKNLHIY